MNLDKDSQEIIQEMQILEQNLHNILMQKQAFQMELNECVNALEETQKTNDDIYKLTGSIMIKSNKEDVKKELEEKKKVLELRLSTLDKQESLLESKSKDLQERAKKIFEKNQESK